MNSIIPILFILETQCSNHVLQCLVVGHTVREPLQLVKEKWLDEHTELNLLDYVSKFKEKIYYACKVAQDNLKHVQHRMKVWYDKNAKVRIFQPGDTVIVFLPVPC
jgi:hypothetical protein